MATYYVATNGSNSNPGTITQPFLTLQKLMDVLTAGDTGYIRGGTYRSTFGNSGSVHLWVSDLIGTSGSPIVISNYQNEVPIFNLDNITSNQTYGFSISISNCAYLTFKALELTGFMQNATCKSIVGIYTSSSNHITIQNCNVHDMGGYGFSCNNSTYVSYINCDASYCSDPLTDSPYENANGFNVTGGVSENTSTNISYYGCRTWKCSDDGFDFYGVDGYITVDRCWAFWNGYDDSFTKLGDGQGFKMGPFYTNTMNSTLRRVITNSIAAGNARHGFDQNTTYPGGEWPGTCIHYFYNNLTYDNGEYGWAFNYNPGIYHIFRNNAAWNNGSGTAALASNVINDHNTWNGGVTVGNADFVGLTVSTLAGARQADGSLPILSFGHLVEGSDLIGAGVAVSGLTLDGDGTAWATLPSMGAFEYHASGGGGVAPTVTTTAVTLITGTTAVSGGNVTSDGGAAVTDRGICWSTTANPTITDSHVHTGTGVGTYTSSITGLTKNTTYHVRAFATNSIGTGYGADVSFSSRAFMMVVY